MEFVKRTIEVAKQNVKQGGRQFACLIVKDNQIIVEAANQVAQTHDPTSHAEIVAIQKASQLLKSEHFTGCTFYILAHPCPMCLPAMFYCSPDKVSTEISFPLSIKGQGLTLSVPGEPSIVT